MPIRRIAGRLERERQNRPGSYLLFALAVILTLGVGWGNDYESCLRSNSVRAAERTSYIKVEQRAVLQLGADKGANHLADLQRVQAAQLTVSQLHPLACAAAFPGTS